MHIKNVSFQNVFKMQFNSDASIYLIKNDLFSLQTVLKTGASGMIAYRYQKKDGEWQWLQTSSRLVYKNSKPDFVICTHRQLMDEEGKDLLGKRTMDFKVNKISHVFPPHVFPPVLHLACGEVLFSPKNANFLIKSLFR